VQATTPKPEMGLGRRDCFGPTGAAGGRPDAAGFRAAACTRTIAASGPACRGKARVSAGTAKMPGLAVKQDRLPTRFAACAPATVTTASLAWSANPDGRCKNGRCRPRHMTFGGGGRRSIFFAGQICCSEAVERPEVPANDRVGDRAAHQRDELSDRLVQQDGADRGVAGADAVGDQHPGDASDCTQAARNRKRSAQRPDHVRATTARPGVAWAWTASRRATG